MKERRLIYKNKEHLSVNTIDEIPWVTSMRELVAKYDSYTPEVIKQKFGNIRILSYKEANLPPSIVSYRHARLAAEVIKGLISATDVIPFVIIEIGTGSGIVPITITKELTDDERRKTVLIATDISGKALEVARLNIEINGVTNIHLRKRDMLDGITAEYGKIDVLISNPPYSRSREIKTEGDYVPRIALDGGIDGLNFHRQLLHEAQYVLSDQGILITQCQKSQLNNLLGIANLHMSRRAKTIIPNQNGGPIGLAVGSENAIHIMNQIIERR